MLLYVAMFLAIGAITGLVAGAVTKASNHGRLADMFLGAVGAFFGSWLFGKLGVISVDLVGKMVVSILGALLVIGVFRLVAKS